MCIQMKKISFYILTATYNSCSSCHTSSCSTKSSHHSRLLMLHDYYFLLLPWNSLRSWSSGSSRSSRPEKKIIWLVFTYNCWSYSYTTSSGSHLLEQRRLLSLLHHSWSWSWSCRCRCRWRCRAPHWHCWCRSEINKFLL